MAISACALVFYLVLIPLFLIVKGWKNRHIIYRTGMDQLEKNSHEVEESHDMKSKYGLFYSGLVISKKITEGPDFNTNGFTTQSKC